jgi:hypothetical protein
MFSQNHLGVQIFTNNEALLGKEDRPTVILSEAGNLGKKVNKKFFQKRGGKTLAKKLGGKKLGKEGRDRRWGKKLGEK